MRIKPVEIAIAALLFAVPAGAAEVQISDAWIRALPPPAPSGGYFILRNTGKAEIALTGAKSPACGMLMLHHSKEMGGMSSMEDVSSVPVPPGGELRFMPGGYHLMCMDPTPAISPGAKCSRHVPILRQERGGGRFRREERAGKVAPEGRITGRNSQPIPRRDRKIVSRRRAPRRENAQ